MLICAVVSGDSSVCSATIGVVAIPQSAGQATGLVTTTLGKLRRCGSSESIPI